MRSISRIQNGKHTRSMFGAFVLACLVASMASAQSIDVGRGAVPLHVPAGYDPGTAAPLVVLLHGYGSTGAVQESYMQFTPLANEFGFLLIAPDGLVDVSTNQFWNGTDACCHFDGGVVDDVAYLTALVDEIKVQFNINERQVYFIGHSNGGFMSYHMACERASMIAAVATLAGATFFEPTDCAPSEPVHILQIHGTADATILFDGGTLNFGTVENVSYPSAVQTVETWATYNGCSLTTDTSQPPLDLVANLPGDESSVTRYIDNCATNGSAELWTMQDGVHIPALSATFSRNIVLHLLAHPKAPSVDSTSGQGLVEETTNHALSVVLSEPAGLTFQWQKESTPNVFNAVVDGGNISGATTTTLTFTGITLADDGRYRLEIDDGVAKAITFSPILTVTVLALGSLPVAGVLGLGLLAGAMGVGGVVSIRRRKK